jgi:predicted PurR-regulated permease PerM
VGVDVTSWIGRGAGLGIGVAIVAGLISLAVTAGSVLLLLFFAVLLASALEPVIAGVRRRLPVGRVGTILIVYAAFFMLVVAIAFIVVPAAVSQAQRLATMLPPFFESARNWAGGLRPAALATSVKELIESVAGIVKPAPAPDPKAVVQVGTAAAEAVASLLTLLTLVFFWLVERARLQRYVLAYLPADRRAGVRDGWNAMETRLGLWVRGQLILMGAMGVATGVAYAILGLPGALLLASIAALAEAIPIVGPLLGAIPAVLVAATVSPSLALVVSGVYVVLQVVEGSILVPTVMRNAIGISPLLVLVSLLVGAAAGGIVGALIAVPVVAAAEAAVQRLQARESPVQQDPASTSGPDTPLEGPPASGPSSV